ncbi:tyrosine-type recombinase/integrase [Lacipirellula sp.]|uniref:tyrosine-type recombinase/integrase n=1 Tax=Lacipirellula sp. TaxID=2691419 RepID=UPI003D0C54EB
MSVKEKKVDWSLTRIVDEVMKPTGRYADTTIEKYMSAARSYGRFRGSEQTAGEITPHLLEKFAEWQIAEGKTEASSRHFAVMVGTIVRQADPNLLPNRNFAEFRDAETGNLLLIMQKEYFPSHPRIGSKATEDQYLKMAMRYSQFLGRHCTLDDLNDLEVGRWMRFLRAEGLKAVSINGYVAKLRAFWNWCAKKRMVELFPTIGDYPEPQSLPDAYTEEEVRQLIAASRLMKGTIHGVRAAVWWETLHRVALDTGERTSALLDLMWRDFDEANATLEAPADIRKGGRKPMLYYLKPKTVALFAELRKAGQKRIFPWPWTKGAYYNHNKKLIKLAGIEYVPRNCGLQKLRRTFASHIEANGGNATAALAHTARRVTERSYLDPRIVKEPPHNEKMFDV